MALYGLTGAHIDAQGRIAQVRMQRVDGANNIWLGEPGQYEEHEVVNMIASGDEVYSIFIVPTGTVLGPKLRRATDENGVEGIELEDDVEGRRIEDLVLF